MGIKVGLLRAPKGANIAHTEFGRRCKTHLKSEPRFAVDFERPQEAATLLALAAFGGRGMVWVRGWGSNRLKTILGGISGLICPRPSTPFYAFMRLFTPVGAFKPGTPGGEDHPWNPGKICRSRSAFSARTLPSSVAGG